MRIRALSIHRPYGERVRAVREAVDLVRRRAGSERAAIELTLEGVGRIVGDEREGRGT